MRIKNVQDMYLYGAVTKMVNETCGSKIGGEILKQLESYQFLRMVLLHCVNWTNF